MSTAHSRRGKSASEFRPVLPSRVDDAAKTALDLTALMRLQHVEQAGRRDLFRFAAAPSATKVRLTTSQSIKEEATASTVPVQLAKEADFSPLVFYGYALRRGSAPSAFVLKDDEIYITKEGELVQNRYRVTAVSLVSVTIEDGMTGDRKKVPILEPR
jgi:hypothetical protein